ncbi:Transcription factor Sp6 [Aphelenchoides besseyi]|nr:Transcription factor Sp6 [Aphelenchoides besseyi]
MNDVPSTTTASALSSIVPSSFNSSTDLVDLSQSGATIRQPESGLLANFFENSTNKSAISMRRGSSPELLSLSNVATPFFDTGALMHGYGTTTNTNGSFVNSAATVNGTCPDVGPYAAFARLSAAWTTHPSHWWPSDASLWSNNTTNRTSELSNQSSTSPNANEQETNAQLNGAASLSLTQLGNPYNAYFPSNFGSLLQVPTSLHMPTLTTSSMLSASNTRLTDSLTSISPTLSSGGGRIRPTPALKSSRFSSARSSNTSRVCECPNCRQLAEHGLTVDKKNEKHNCHVPGCQKIYSKPSHLKAHLRWHDHERTPTYQQNRRNGELSHSRTLSSTAV